MWASLKFYLRLLADLTFQSEFSGYTKDMGGDTARKEIYYSLVDFNIPRYCMFFLFWWDSW